MHVKTYVTDEILAARGWLNKIGETDYEIVKGNADDVTGTDIILKIRGNVILVEVKIEDYWPYKTGNITLDAISAFSWKSKPVRIQKLSQLLPYVTVHKWGTLYNSKDDLMIKMIRDAKQGKQNFFAYDISKLQDPNFLSYVEDNYDIKLNPKKQYGLYESWESAFFCVKMTDPMLVATEVSGFNF